MAEETQPAEATEQQPAPTTAPTTLTGKKLTMAVKVYAPFEIFFDGPAYSISAVNRIGPFDILPRHRNFLCMLLPCNVVIESPEGKKVVKVSRALMHVKADRVVVFMDV